MKKFNPSILLFVIALGIFVGLNLNNDFFSTTESLLDGIASSEVSQEQAEATVFNTENQSGNTSKLNYEIIYSIVKRYDGGTSYYVLLESVDLNSAVFMDDVKYIVDELVREKGEKISIEIFDNRDALELAYKQYGDLSLERTLTESENLWQARHYIAAYSGNLETGIYFNTLLMFPSASSDHPEVGEFVAITEYNPE
ncbi:hypothetical protein CQS04_01845 [Chryseomicrobium excrementi]|uniref:Uncharacterized protein n=1 Tax=Chryseomicrobium excrementi TaxID=2041346 RepID=A0A2M9F2E8_9BACL|nr:hypothetical protein [Chryseomicrobium excrementi]PJK17643.1 hypothetical protein CQS04_01845 [Chryseomicrobium excrementi]